VPGLSVPLVSVAEVIILTPRPPLLLKRGGENAGKFSVLPPLHFGEGFGVRS